MAEAATAGETTTGADATRVVTPAGLSQSEFGTAYLLLRGAGYGDAVATGDGKDFAPVPAKFDGWVVVSVQANVVVPSSSGLPTWQLARVRGGAAQDMLTTRVTIDETEYDSSTADTPAVLDATVGNRTLATGDVIRLDCDVAGTGTKGPGVLVGIRMPAA
jgi:hypothetical protein